MDERDFEPFCGLLDDVWGLYPNAKVPNDGQKAMFFRALSAHSIAKVRAGFDGHVKDAQRGRFAPLPADIVAQIDGHAAIDGRPGPEEGWTIALQASDEQKTVVWTDEIAQAWGIAQPLFQRGDEIGARMAFKEAYNRLLLEARKLGRKVAWTETLGLDAAQRDEALERAHVAGLLPKPEKLRELPAPDHAMTGKTAPAAARASLLALRDKFATKTAEPAPASGNPIGVFTPIEPGLLDKLKGAAA